MTAVEPPRGPSSSQPVAVSAVVPATTSAAAGTRRGFIEGRSATSSTGASVERSSSGAGRARGERGSEGKAAIGIVFGSGAGAGAAGRAPSARWTAARARVIGIGRSPTTARCAPPGAPPAALVETFMSGPEGRILLQRPVSSARSEGSGTRSRSGVGWTLSCQLTVSISERGVLPIACSPESAS